MAAGATELRIVRERFEEQRLSSLLAVHRQCRQAAARTEIRIDQEVDVLDVNDDGVEDRGRRLRACKLADDDVVNEIAQRCDAAIMAVGAEEARPAQAVFADALKTVDAGLNDLVTARIEQLIRPQIIRDGSDAHVVAEELRSKLRGSIATTTTNAPVTTSFH